VVETKGLWRSVAKHVEAHPVAERVFISIEKKTKESGFGCRMCGQCALPTTGYACPMTCPKQLRNGPCGGVGEGGSCEVYPEQQCVWVQAYERAVNNGHLDDLRLLQRPIDHRRFGQSSWINYWSGRDDDLAVLPDPDGARGPVQLHPVRR
jgi:hypothetical protein